MVIGGFDIASYKTGYFFLDTDKINYKIGLIEAKGPNLYERVRQISDKSKLLFDKYNPDLIIIESTYLDDWRKHKKGSKKRGNIDTLKTLEKCHGAIIANTKDFMDIKYMTPTEHKEALTGMGHAGKQSTIWTIQKKLNLVGIDDNMADSAALVLTYLVKKKQWHILEKIKNKYETP
jgi:Holliday junction resolvasome RuvABC endonuclease subunit